MKKLILIAIFLLLLIPFVYSTEKSLKVDEFEKCTNLTVNVNGGGYYELENCNLTGSNTWFCACKDNYKLYIKILDDLLYDYEFGITHNWMEFAYSGNGEIQTISKTETKKIVNRYKSNHCSSLCGDGICIDTKLCIEDKQTCSADCLSLNETEENTTTQQNNVPSPTLEEEKLSVGMILTMITIFGVIGFTIFAIILSYFVQKKKDAFEELKETLKYEDLQDWIKENE